MIKCTMLICVLFVALCTVAANAQWVKGNSYAGLRIGLGPKESGLLVGADYEQALTKGNDTYGPGSIGVGASLDYTSYSKEAFGIKTTSSYFFLSIYGAYHLGPAMDDKRLDPYLLIGLAPYRNSVTTESNDVTFTGATASRIDVAFVGALGIRYFFTPQWSAHLRLGFGGSFVSAGATMTL